MSMLLFYVVSKRGVVFLTHFLVDERQAVKFFYVFSQQFSILGRESVRVYRVCERALFAVTTGAVRVQEISAVSLCEPFWEDDTVAGGVFDGTAMLLGRRVGLRFDNGSLLSGCSGNWGCLCEVRAKD
jgi:hypothetical protein